MKRYKRNRLILILVCVLAAGIIAALIIFNTSRQGGARVFTDGSQIVTLRDNGTFTARLTHDKRISGRYSEDSAGGVFTITFTYDGVTAAGSFEGIVLILPDEWDDGHGHGSRLTLSGEPQGDTQFDGPDDYGDD